MSVGYAKKYARFKSESEAAREGGTASASALGQALKYYGGQEGGFFGQASGTKFTPHSDRSWNSALTYRDELQDAYTEDELKSHEGYQKVQGNINKFLGKGGPGQNLATMSERSNAWNQFGTTEQTKGTGLLGGMKQIGTGLDTLTGGYPSKAAGAVGDFAMKYGGQWVKDAGTKVAGRVAESAVGQGLGAVASGLMSVAGPVMAMKQVYDFANQTVDAYEGLEQGVENAEFGLIDLASQRSSAKDLMINQNKAIARTIEEGRGKMKESIGGQAEQILTAYDNQAGKTNLETDMGDAKKENIKEALSSRYSEGSTSLKKQKENLTLTNVEGYRRQNQGLIQAESDVQSSIDDMQSEMDSMEWMYKGSKAFQMGSPLAHLEGKV
jgi:hypothetical protein